MNKKHFISLSKLGIIASIGTTTGAEDHITRIADDYAEKFDQQQDRLFRRHAKIVRADEKKYASTPPVSPMVCQDTHGVDETNNSEETIDQDYTDRLDRIAQEYERKYAKSIRLKRTDKIDFRELKAKYTQTIPVNEERQLDKAEYEQKAIAISKKRHRRSRSH
jgi:hypothetical protein